MSRLKRKSLVLIIVLSVIAVLTAYAMIVCLPYAGGLKVSADTRNSFDAQSFFGNSESKERAMILDDSKQSFTYRMDLVRRAENELYFTTYSTHEGYTSSVFFGGLIAAADRGVKVHVLTDGKFGGLSARTKEIFKKHENIDFYLYNSFNLFKPQYINVAMHDKFLIADDKYMIFGGRNVGDKYYAHEDYKKQLSLDREVLIYGGGERGGGIEQVKGYFEELKNSKHTRRINSKKALDKKADREKKRMLDLYGEYVAAVSGEQEIDYFNLTAATNKITLVTNPVNGTKKEPIVAFNLYSLAKTSSEVIVQSPYTVLTAANIRHLKELTKNTSVRLLTNSLASTPNLPAFSVYLADRKKLIGAGLKIYEYQPTAGSLHAKTVIFDNRLSAVGSFNLDERSIRIDTESMLIIDSGELNASMRQTLDSYFDDCLEVGEDNRYIQSSSVAETYVKKSKRNKYKIAGVFCSAVKYLI